MCRLGYLIFIQISVCNRMNVNVNVDVVTICYILWGHKLPEIEGSCCVSNKC